MDWDEPQAKNAATITIGEQLAPLSLAELEARVEAHRAEIKRLEAEIHKKRAHGAAAESVFKT